MHIMEFNLFLNSDKDIKEMHHCGSREGDIAEPDRRVPTSCGRTEASL